MAKANSVVKRKPLKITADRHRRVRQAHAIYLDRTLQEFNDLIVDLGLNAYHENKSCMHAGIENVD